VEFLVHAEETAEADDGVDDVVLDSFVEHDVLDLADFLGRPSS